MRLLHSGGLQVVQNHGDKVATVFSRLIGGGIEQLTVGSYAENAMRREAFYGKWTGDTDFFLVLIGLVIQKFVVCMGGDGCVDFLLASNTSLPPGGVEFLDPLDARSTVNGLNRNALLCCTGQP